MIFTVNSKGAVTHISQEWVKLTGQDISSAMNEGWLSRVHEEDRQIVTELLRKAAETAAEFNIRFRLCSEDGSCRWIGSANIP